jgi:putative hemolysin
LRSNRIRSSDRDSVPERERELSLRRPRSRLSQAARLTGTRRSVEESPRAPAFSFRSRALFLIALAALALIAFQIGVWAQGENAPGTTGQNSEPGGSVWIDLLTVAVLVIITGVFVLAETALLTVRRTRIDQLVEEHNRSARVVQQLLSEPTRMLATLQVGLTLVQLFSAGEATHKFVGPMTVFIRRIFGTTGFVGGNAAFLAFVAVIFTVGLATLVIGEITPKSIGIRYSERFALLFAYPIRWLQIVASLLVSLVTFLSNILVKPFGGTASFHAAAMSEEELKIMVEQSEEHGVIETEEKEMIHKVFEFADTVARKVMTPRLDVTAIEADVTTDELIQTVTSSGHSRLPVYDDNLDNIVGIVHVKDVLAGITSGNEVSIRDLMRPPYFIPENKRVDDLLTEFRRNKTQIAVVRDEYGTVVGIVTIEDLVEEVFGEIQDEYDVEEPEWKTVDDETCIVDGRMELDDFNDRMGVELPIEESDTLGGFLFGLLGHQPVKGELAVWDGLELKVEETDGRRIQRIRVCRKPAAAHAEAADGRTASEPPRVIEVEPVEPREEPRPGMENGPERNGQS